LRNVYGEIDQQAVKEFRTSKTDTINKLKNMDFVDELDIYDLAESYRLFKDIDKETADSLKLIADSLSQEQKNMFNKLIELFDMLISGGQTIW